MRTLRQKVRRKCVPLDRNSGSKRQKRKPFVKKCVEHAYPRAEIKLLRSTENGNRNEGRPRGVGSGRGQKCDPLGRKCVENAYP